MKREIRILHLEDSHADAELIANALRKSGLNATIRYADDRETFLAGLKDFEPHVVLSDHSLAQFDVKAAVRLVQAHRPMVPVILVTESGDPRLVAEAMKAGIEDAVHKGSLSGLAGIIEGAVTKRVPLSRLTPRQLQVLRLVAEGLSSPRIARRLNLSEKTVESHRSEIMKRLEIHDLVSLVRFAVSTRLISGE